MAQKKDITTLIFCHVDIITNVKVGREFTSEFSRSLPGETLVYSGYLKTFDPITGSVVLSLVQDEKIVANTLILGDTVSDIVESTDKDPYDYSPDVIEKIFEANNKRLAEHPFFKRSECTQQKFDDQSNNDMVELRDEITAWLKENRIPVESDERTHVITVGGCVKIREPYEHESDYVCPTQVVLKRLKYLVDSRPTQIFPRTTL